MYCPCCGHKNGSKTRFCLNCGYYLTEKLIYDFSLMKQEPHKARRW